MAQLVIVGFFILLVACGVGFGVATAEVTSAAARTDSFGFNEATRAATARVTADGSAAAGAASAPGAEGAPGAPGASAEQGMSGATADEQTRTQAAQAAQAAQAEFSAQIAALGTSSHRTLDAGFQMIDEQEAREAQRLEAEKAEALARVAANQRKQGKQGDVASSGEDTTDAYGLSAVDWTVGKDAFLAEWTARIDEYLKGSNLAGYGAVFAEAAWAHGVDPRWSPAISNTESGKGSVCFLPYNAWGWGSRAWSSWTSAIAEHVAGLAEGYGYSLTETAALKYCPPTYMDWYNTTFAQMRLI